MAYLDTLYSKMETAATAYATAYNNGEGRKVLKDLKSKVTSAVNAYNLETEKAAYRKWAGEGDAVLTAIRTRYVPDIKRIQFKPDKNADTVTVLINDVKDKEIDLPLMQATVGAGVFANKRWFNMAEKLMYLYANRINRKLGNTPGFKYAIEDASHEFDFPKDFDPASDEGVIKGLQMVFDAILFVDDGNHKNAISATAKLDEYGNTYTEAWENIKNGMTDGDGTTTWIKDTGRFTHLVANAMHTILTHGKFACIAASAYERPVEKVSGEEAEETDE